MTTRSQTELEEAILRAKGAGNLEEMRSLQAQYRNSHFPIVRVSHHAGAIGIREGSRSWSSATTATGTATTTRGRSVPFVSPVPDTETSVVFTAQAEGALREIPFDTGIEVGAFCFGEFSGRDVLIHQVLELSREATRSRVWLDYRAALQWADHFGRANWRLLGCLHSHPGASTRACSFEDAAAWTSLASHHAHPWIGAIAFEHQSWAGGRTWGFVPEIHAWIAQPGAVTVASVNVAIERSLDA